MSPDGYAQKMLRRSLEQKVLECARAKDRAIGQCLESAARQCGSLEEAQSRVERVVVAERDLTVVTLNGIPHPSHYGIFHGWRGTRYVVGLVSLDEAWPEWRTSEAFGGGAVEF